MSDKEITLASAGLTVGDIVTYSSDDDSTGGVIFQISANYDSPIPLASRRWGQRYEHPVTKRRLKPMEVEGYVRLKPLFTFFPTSLGKAPRGLGSTVLVYHRGLVHVKKVELVEIASKYAELGHLILDLARRGGMANEATVNEATNEADSAHG